MGNNPIDKIKSHLILNLVFFFFPKVMKIHGERESTELKDFVVEEGSPSCSPSWGWYVTDSTGNTPQSGAALASR